MAIFWEYIRYAIIILLLFALGWGIVSRTFSRERSIASLEAALCIADKNRLELEKVLRYYQRDTADSLKYKATCFLIENMPYYSYACGEQLEKYKLYYMWLKNSKGKSPQLISDSIKKVFGPIGNTVRKRDILEIDSAYLCSNIEWAFKVWKEQPWGKNISFDYFVSIYFLIVLMMNHWLIGVRCIMKNIIHY